MTKFICSLIVVALVSTYGIWLNVKTGNKKAIPWELLGVFLAVGMILLVFFSTLYALMFFTKTVWGMI